MPRNRVTSKTVSVPAATGGWNTRDPLGSMPIEDAVIMYNIFPTPTSCNLRNGWTPQSSGFTGIARSLVTYASGSQEELFGTSGTNIYDFSDSIAVAQPINITVDEMFWTSFGTSGGNNFILGVNGFDPLTFYNGSTWYRAQNSTASAKTVSSITAVMNTCTLTTAVAHGLTVGNQIVISGAAPTQYNGTWRINSTPTPTTFTFTSNANPTGAATTLGSYAINFVISGVDSSTFSQVNSFKNRLWFCVTGSLAMWYLPTDSIAGVAQRFDLSNIAKSGGYIIASGTWTIDAGQGIDDYVVFITNRGEVIVYQGTDPANATEWSLKGVWQIGTVFNRRCLHKWGGDLLILTNDGLVPMAQALQSSRLDPRINLTDKIYTAFSDAANSYSIYQGWQIIYYANPNMLLVNIPVGPTTTEQYIMNTINKSWTRFININAWSFVIYRDNLFFGGNGVVGKYYDGSSDNGVPILGSTQQAFNYFDSPGQLKRFMLMRPNILSTSQSPALNFGLNFDFALTNPLSPPANEPLPATSALWDSALWDSAVWGSGNFVVNSLWRDVSGIGTSAGILMKIASGLGGIRWISTDLTLESGGIL